MTREQGFDPQHVSVKPQAKLPIQARQARHMAGTPELAGATA